MTTTNELPEGITQAAIDAAVSLYPNGEVKHTALPLDEEQTRFMNVLTRVPDVSCISQYQQWSDKNWKKATELLIRGTVIGKENADTIMSNTRLYLAATAACMERIPGVKGITKNL